MKAGMCRTRFVQLVIAVSLLVTGAVLFGAQPSLAAPNTCIQDVWKAHGNNQNLTCTANDVTLSRAINIDISGGGQCAIENGVKVCKCNSGGQVTLPADFRMDLTPRHPLDIAFH